MKVYKQSTGEVIDGDATLVERVDEPGIADLVTSAENVEVKGIKLSEMDSPDVWVQ